jgi:hypothetical protein
MLRAFTDSSGVQWRVWDVLPNATSRPYSGPSGLPASLNGTSWADGWLCFECSVEKRRLAPIPPGWQFRGEHDLAQLCMNAVLVPERRHRPTADPSLRSG